MSSAPTTVARCVALVVAIGTGRLAAGSENVVIYSNIAGHPTAQVPGVHPSASLVRCEPMTFVTPQAAPAPASH